MMSGVIPEKKKRPRWLWLTGTLLLFVVFILLMRNFTSKRVDPLTVEERTWLKAHPVIRLAPDPEFPPVESFDKNSEYNGITKDYVSLIEKKLGVRFKIVRLRDWNEIINKAKSREIDIYVATKTPQRAEYMMFTKPFLEFPAVIIAREKVKGPLKLERMSGMKVSVVSEYAAHNFIAYNYPKLNLDMVPDVETGLRKVSFGLSDVFVENLATVTYYIEKEGITNLRMAGESGYVYKMGFASRKDLPELNRILEKGLAEISADEKKAIYKKWIPVEPISLLASKKFQAAIFSAFGVAILIILGIFTWNRALTRQVSRRTEELEKELSERKLMEEELQHAREDLEKKVEERTAELRNANELLQREITVRKRAIAELELTQFYVNKASIGIHRVSEEGNIIFANEVTCRSLCYTPEELCSMTVFDIAPTFNLEKFLEHRRITRAAGSRTFETIHRRKDGSTFPVEITVNYLEYQDKEFSVCFARDITERKEAEEALRESRAKYQAIVDAFDGLIYVCSQDYRIEFMNRKLIERTGRDAVGELCYKVMHDRDSVCPWCVNDRVFAGETVHWDMFSPKDKCWYEVLNVPIHYADGSMSKHSVMVDINDRILFEKELQRQKKLLEELNDTLEKRVREEVAKNREKDIMLIQQNRQAALGEMLDHIAHQWKQPLNSISLTIQALEETASDCELTDELVKETVSKIMVLLDHMAQTIDVFRGFYRPDKEKKVFSIKDSIDQALAFIEPAFRFHSIAVEIDVDPGVTAFGYPKEYAQVLLNILANARDVFRARSTEKPRVTIRSFEEDNKAVATITDNAGGIPETIIGKIFEFYFTTNESSGGTGIGLYMSQNIIEKSMGGTLSAANTEEGAQFRIEVKLS